MKFAVFEHDNDETEEWFGNRPKSEIVCDGKTCCLVQMETQLAASWKHKNRHLSVIGVRDVAEVDDLVRWMEGSGNE